MKVFTEVSGSLVSVSMIRALKQSGLFVITSDISKQNAGGLIADKYLVLPKKEDKSLWKKLEKKLNENNVDYVIPSFDDMLNGWARRSDFFLKQGINIVLSPSETINIFTDKWKTYNAFLENNIPAPKASLDKVYSLVKPLKGRGSKGVYITDKKVSMEGLMSQEIALGQELTVDCLFDNDGIPIYIVPRKRLRVIDGKSVDGELVKHEKVSSYIKKLAKKYFFRGPINIQCFVKENEIMFIEVNPRIGGGMELSWAGTENWFDLWFNKIMLNKSFKPKQIKYGLKMYRYYDAVYDDEI